MISFSNINKQYGRQLLFVDASFQLNPGEKVGLVGPNGAGKTTLFRMAVGEETPDEGSVSVPKKLTIGYFRQDSRGNAGPFGPESYVEYVQKLGHEAPGIYS
jgi:ATPase subunit of ABC transporter with duplicated ATPase domains